MLKIARYQARATVIYLIFSNLDFNHSPLCLPYTIFIKKALPSNFLTDFPLSLIGSFAILRPFHQQFDPWGWSIPNQIEIC